MVSSGSERTRAGRYVERVCAFSFSKLSNLEPIWRRPYRSHTNASARLQPTGNGSRSKQ